MRVPERAAELSARVLDHLVQSLDATEETAPGGGPAFEADTEHATSRVRVFSAPGGFRVVSTLMHAKGRVHDTHGVFGFSPVDSALPHLSFDTSDRAEEHAFHVDLLPRVELAVAVPYMDEVHEPLTEASVALEGVEGVRRTPRPSRQRALMSPWMIAFLLSPEAFDGAEPVVRAYVDHWLRLAKEGLGPEALASVEASGTDLAARDAVVRRNLFSSDVEPVWKRVEHMLGVEQALTMRSVILGLP